VSTPSYFSNSTPADELLERLRADYLRALRTGPSGRLYPHYARVQDYDPVLRAHCRLDPAPKPKNPEPPK